MISQWLFTVLIVTAWLAEFAFGSLVIYWFVTQDFGDSKTSGEITELETSASVYLSLLLHGEDSSLSSAPSFSLRISGWP